MRYFKNKSFYKDLKDADLDEKVLQTVLDDILAGKAVSLGAKLYKIRIAGAGKGKRGGYRSIFFWKQDRMIIFCLLFSKSMSGDIDEDTRKALRILSDVYDNLTINEIKQAVNERTLMEIFYEKKCV